MMSQLIKQWRRNNFMAFVFKYTKDGSTPQTKYYPADAVTITKDQPLYFSGGYVTNADFSACKTHNVAGISEATQVCSAGDLVPVQINRAAVYEGDVSDDMIEANVGKNVLLSAIGTIASDTNADDDTGVFRIEKLISTTKAEVSINFSAPSDSA